MQPINRKKFAKNKTNSRRVNRASAYKKTKVYLSQVDGYKLEKPLGNVKAQFQCKKIIFIGKRDEVLTF